MKKVFSILIFVFAVFQSFGQVSINSSGYVEPLGAYPAYDNQYLKGGFKSGPDQTSRDSYPAYLRDTQNFIYFTTSDASFWILKGGIDNTNWVKIGSSSGDNLGNHTATQNIKLANFTLSSDGTDGKGLGFDVSGNATFNQNMTVNGNFYSPSDKRLKMNIVTLTNVLQKLDRIRGVHFEYIDKNKYSGGPKIGVIAQELQKVYPDLVMQGSDGFLKVDYMQLSGVLLQAIKEQQVLIKQQQQEINGLKARLNKQQKQINYILKKLN